MIGQTVSHYKILEKLGGGGMGVVYKAQDTKLDRFVALKFLPPALTLDPEAKERFIHEAKAASALQHNNICTVHDVDESPDGQMFIVMDFYEGETLKSRIAKGALRIEEATDLAIQIAQGLAKAHESGIVHRDIKPANIMITRDGVAKIVDFGLAKLSSATKLTKTGSTLGTVAYMAPEQLQGSGVDSRADIFSLGVLLYEMLTGKTPFRGDHEAALMYSIMNEEPEPLQRHIPDVTSELIHVVSRALEKDPASRYKTMDDLLIDLRRVRKETSKVFLPAFGGRRLPFFRSRAFLVTASVIVLAGVAATVILLNHPRKMPQINPDRRVSNLQLPSKWIGSCCMSPDGNWIAIEGEHTLGKEDIYYMNTAGGAVRQVTFDSSLLAAPTDISRDGALILYTRIQRGPGPWEVMAVPSLGGSVRKIAAGAWASFAPGATDRVLYITGKGYGPSASGKLEVWSTNTDGSDARGIFVDPGNSSPPVVSGLSVAFALSPNGKELAWLKTFPDFSQDVIVRNLESGKERQLTFTQGPKDFIIWTKDSYLLFAAHAAGNYDVWMYPAEGGEQLQVTRSPNDEMNVMLSEDRSKLLFYERNSPGNLKSMDIASGRVTSITNDDRPRRSVTISPDKRYVAYSIPASYDNILTWWGIQILDLKGEERERTICADERVTRKAWSMDGKWIAYERLPDSVGGAVRICVVSPSAGTQPRVVTEVKGRVIPRWFATDTVSWFSGMKTWICATAQSNPVQFYEDSTNAFRISGGKAILYFDFRSGRRGWWIDASPLTKKAKKGPTKLNISGNVILAPSGDFILYNPTQSAELYRISLPEGRSAILPFVWPREVSGAAITQDGKDFVFIEKSSNSKLMLWENPFIRE